MLLIGVWDFKASKTLGYHFIGIEYYDNGAQLRQNGEAYRVQGYIEGSALSELRLPDDLHIVKENGVWKWQGIVDSKQTE